MALVATDAIFNEFPLPATFSMRVSFSKTVRQKRVREALSKSGWNCEMCASYLKQLVTLAVQSTSSLSDFGFGFFKMVFVSFFTRQVVE